MSVSRAGALRRLVLLSACLGTLPACLPPDRVEDGAARQVAVVAPRPQPLRRPSALPLPPLPPEPAPPEPQADAAGPAQPPVEEVAPIAAPAAPEQDREGSVWRVVADGTVGCAAPGPLRIVRGQDGQRRASRRAMMAALDEGRCLTTFRVNEWVLLQVEADLVALRLTNPRMPGEPPLRLWFARRDVVDGEGRHPGDPGAMPLRPAALD